MGKFLIFFKRGQDPGIRIDGISDQAEACKSATGKNFIIRRIDVSVGDPDLVHWSGQATIECVTVAAGAVVDREIQPSPPGVGRMVRNLP